MSSPLCYCKVPSTRSHSTIRFAEGGNKEKYYFQCSLEGPKNCNFFKLKSEFSVEKQINEMNQQRSMTKKRLFSEEFYKKDDRETKKQKLNYFASKDQEYQSQREKLMIELKKHFEMRTQIKAQIDAEEQRTRRLQALEILRQQEQQRIQAEQQKEQELARSKATLAQGLMKYKLEDLRDICRARNMYVTGNKPQLVWRILHPEQSTKPDEITRLHRRIMNRYR